MTCISSHFLCSISYSFCLQVAVLKPCCIYCFCSGIIQLLSCIPINLLNFKSDDGRQWHTTDSLSEKVSESPSPKYLSSFHMKRLATAFQIWILPRRASRALITSFIQGAGSQWGREVEERRQAEMEMRGLRKEKKRQMEERK